MCRSLPDFQFCGIVFWQVYATGLKVLAGSEEVQELPIQDILPSMEWRPNVVIAAACVADPYVLLHFSDGSAVLLSGDADEGMSCCGRCSAAAVSSCDFVTTQCCAAVQRC